MLPDDSFSFSEIVAYPLAGEPPPGFDCGRETQNRFLYECAWRDQQERVSSTWLYYAKGLFIAYATVCLDAIPLGTREKPRTIRYKYIGALKLAQLGVDRRFHGSGLGTEVVADILDGARQAPVRFTCRYVTVDAQPDLVGWYGRRGFVINKLLQKQRLEAVAGKRDPADLAVSMRFDLLRKFDMRTSEER